VPIPSELKYDVLDFTADRDVTCVLLNSGTIGCFGDLKQIMTTEDQDEANSNTNTNTDPNTIEINVEIEI